MFNEIFLAIIVSIDTYIAATAYCNSGIRIPISSALIINAIGAAVLGLSMRFSAVISNFASQELCQICGTILLTFMGAFIIIKSMVRSIARHISNKGEMSLKMGKSSLVVRLYLDDTAADFDNSKLLSIGEAAALALVSSLDSAATGLGSGFSSISFVWASILTFICGFIAIFLGNLTGKKSASLNKDFSWAGGVLLIIFAFVI